MRYCGQIFVSDDAMDGIFHECGHALVSSLAFGRGIVQRVETHECILRHRPPNGRRATLLCAAGGVAGERVGKVNGCNVSTSDTIAFSEALLACPASEALTFSQAVDAAVKLIEANRAAFDAMCHWLMREGSMSGEMVDFILLQHRGEPAMLH
jgi:hypothetical protein